VRRLDVVAGGPPTREQAAAIASAIAAVMADERSAPAATIPAAYGSRWRRSGIERARRRGPRGISGWGHR
jgi:hypothetical protein